MNRSTLFAFCLAISCASLTCAAQTPIQTPIPDAHTTQDLIARAKQAGAGKPLFSEILSRYPNHYTMLVSRHADGQSELHQRYADVIIILEGEGQIITGGTMEGPNSTAPGEQRGTGVAGGTVAALHKGDIIHIPANVPHQVKIPSNGSLIYFVVKVDESARSTQGN